MGSLNEYFRLDTFFPRYYSAIHKQLNSVLQLYPDHLKATSNKKICITNKGIPLGIPSKLNWIGSSHVSGMKGFPLNALWVFLPIPPKRYISVILTD